MWCAWRILIICVSLPILVKALKCDWDTAKRAGVTEQALSLLYRDGFEKVETGVLVYKVGVASLLFILLSLHKQRGPCNYYTTYINLWSRHDLGLSLSYIDVTMI